MNANQNGVKWYGEVGAGDKGNDDGMGFIKI